MAYLIFDHARDSVTLARAGHDAPLLYSGKARTVTPLKPPGMVVGIDSGDVFDRLTKDVAVPLERDDCILLYTDGITEALDNEGNEFGLERTMEAVRVSAKEGAQAIVTRLIDELRNFVGSTAQNDDITLIAIRKT
jgi:sigma-B regulation protein RsbU (phosphoserine phosphatase)